ELNRFVELSGLPIPETDTNVIMKSSDRTDAVLKIADSQLQAELAFWRSQTKYVYVVDERNGLVDYQEHASTGENARILFQYTVIGSGQPVQGWELEE
ncbi:MAG: hypothetical protein K2G51_16210, partial [Lachnospiraceae bacterium]|nr:hypothetical protein [Lachnospiraceae bacterium]